MQENVIENMNNGQILDESFTDYLSNDAISSSDLKNFLEAPALFKEGRKEKDSESTKAQELGTAIHDVLLCGGEHTVLAKHLDLRKKADKEEYAELKFKYRSVVRGSDVDIIQGLKDSVEKNSPDFMSLVAGSEPERSFYAKCPATGMMLKARPDLVNREKKAKLDLKTTTDPIKFINEAYRYKYYIQDAYHSYVMSLCGYDVDISGWFAVGKTAPYLQRLVLIDKGTQAELKEHVINSLKDLKKALNSPNEEKIFSPRLETLNFIFTEHI